MATDSRRKTDDGPSVDEEAIKRRDRNSLILFIVIAAVAVAAMIIISGFLSGN